MDDHKDEMIWCHRTGEFIPVADLPKPRFQGDRSYGTNGIPLGTLLGTPQGQWDSLIAGFSGATPDCL